MTFPTWIVGPLMKLADWVFPKRPRLTMEIRQVCFDRILSSLTPDFSDYTFDLYLFLEVWAANQKEVPTTIKDWKLTVFGDGQKFPTEQLPDISAWHQHIKLKEEQHGFHVIRDVRNRLDKFPALPLQQGIASQGWVCFIAREMREALLKNVALELLIVDSFGRTHSVMSKGPWPCKGDVVNPQMPW
jgi:hypothetical protein